MKLNVLSVMLLSAVAFATFDGCSIRENYNHFKDKVTDSVANVIVKGIDKVTGHKEPVKPLSLSDMNASSIKIYIIDNKKCNVSVNKTHKVELDFKETKSFYLIKECDFLNLLENYKDLQIKNDKKGKYSLNMKFDVKTLKGNELVAVKKEDFNKIIHNYRVLKRLDFKRLQTPTR